MRRGRKTTAIAAILSLGVSGALISQPAVSSVQDMSPDSILGWNVEETWASGGVSTAAITLPSNGYLGEAYCSEIGPGKRSVSGPSASCDPKDYRGDVRVQYFLKAPVCGNQTRNCISQVSAVGPDGATVRGEFVRYKDSEELFVLPNSRIGNPLGAAPGIWKLPGVKNSLGSDLYEVDLHMENGLADFRNGRMISGYNLTGRTFSTQIKAVQNEKGDTGGEQAFLPLDYEFAITAILPKSSSSWYAGRLAGPSVNYKKVDQTYNQITISGKPVTIPTFTPQIKRSEATPELLEVFHFCRGWEPSCIGWYTQGMGKTNFLEPFRPLMKDKASANQTLWAMRTAYPGFSGAERFFQCAPQDRAAGISTTNAMIFTGTIPQYKGGFFSYDVAGLHYEPDGATKFLGQYEMAMDEQLARCMFGFPRTPLSATVNVINRDGTKAIATTLVGTKNGQLRLSAYNFTFSRKTIQVQLRAKGHTTCVRGDTVRFVKGTRCPGGFKKSK